MQHLSMWLPSSSAPRATALGILHPPASTQPQLQVYSMNQLHHGHNFRYVPSPRFSLALHFFINIAYRHSSLSQSPHQAPFTCQCCTTWYAPFICIIAAIPSVNSASLSSRGIPFGTHHPSTLFLGASQLLLLQDSGC